MELHRKQELLVGSMLGEVCSNEGEGSRCVLVCNGEPLGHSSYAIFVLRSSGVRRMHALGSIVCYTSVDSRIRCLWDSSC